MTKEQILEFNKKCAIFIGAKHYNDDPENFPEGYWLLDDEDCDIDLPYFLSDMTFHSDRNLIMKISEAIVAQGFRQYTISHEAFSRCVLTDMSILEQKHNFDGGNIVADSGECGEYIQALVAAIDKFFTWYYGR